MVEHNVADVLEVNPPLAAFAARRSHDSHWRSEEMDNEAFKFLQSKLDDTFNKAQLDSFKRYSI